MSVKGKTSDRDTDVVEGLYGELVVPAVTCGGEMSMRTSEQRS